MPSSRSRADVSSIADGGPSTSCWLVAAKDRTPARINITGGGAENFLRIGIGSRSRAEEEEVPKVLREAAEESKVKADTSRVRRLVPTSSSSTSSRPTRCASTTVVVVVVLSWKRLLCVMILRRESIQRSTGWTSWECGSLVFCWNGREMVRVGDCEGANDIF